MLDPIIMNLKRLKSRLAYLICCRIMNCEILSTLYMKSNGEILCNDDYGERICLGVVPDLEKDFDADLLLANEQYQLIRDAFSEGRVPWTSICQNCAFLRADEPIQDLLAKKIIKKFQLEPSLACNLACPCCSSFDQRRTRSKPHIMAPETFNAVLRSLKVRQYQLDWIEYCGQGEPLMNPRFSDFVEIGRRHFPEARQRLITNGNFNYQSATGGTFIDEIFVSCDGVYQQSYQQYRVRGQVKKALDFMRDTPREIEGHRQLLIWKYILFEFNDSDEEIMAAQKLAQELNVDTLLFVLTRSRFHSQKYTKETIGNLPILYPNVTTNAHPSFYKVFKQGQLIPERAASRGLLARLKRKSSIWFKQGRLTSEGTACDEDYRSHLDEITILQQNILTLRGWAAGITPVSRVEIYWENTYIGTVIPCCSRPDVFSTFLDYYQSPAGFFFSSPLKTSVSEKAKIRLEIYSENCCVAKLENIYWFS